MSSVNSAAAFASLTSGNTSTSTSSVSRMHAPSGRTPPRHAVCCRSRMLTHRSGAAGKTRRSSAAARSPVRAPNRPVARPRGALGEGPTPGTANLPRRLAVRDGHGAVGASSSAARTPAPRSCRRGAPGGAWRYTFLYPKSRSNAPNVGCADVPALTSRTTDAANVADALSGGDDAFVGAFEWRSFSRTASFIFGLASRDGLGGRTDPSWGPDGASRPLHDPGLRART